MDEKKDKPSGFSEPKGVTPFDPVLSPLLPNKEKPTSDIFEEALEAVEKMKPITKH